MAACRGVSSHVGLFEFPLIKRDKKSFLWFLGHTTHSSGFRSHVWLPRGASRKTGGPARHESRAFEWRGLPVVQTGRLGPDPALSRWKLQLLQDPSHSNPRAAWQSERRCCPLHPWADEGFRTALLPRREVEPPEPGMLRGPVASALPGAGHLTSL